MRLVVLAQAVVEESEQDGRADAERLSDGIHPAHIRRTRLVRQHAKARVEPALIHSPYGDHHQGARPEYGIPQQLDALPQPCPHRRPRPRARLGHAAAGEGEVGHDNVGVVEGGAVDGAAELDAAVVVDDAEQLGGVRGDAGCGLGWGGLVLAVARAEDEDEDDEGDEAGAAQAEEHGVLLVVRRKGLDHTGQRQPTAEHTQVEALLGQQPQGEHIIRHRHSVGSGKGCGCWRGGGCVWWCDHLEDAVVGAAVVRRADHRQDVARSRPHEACSPPERRSACQHESVVAAELGSDEQRVGQRTQRHAELGTHQVDDGSGEERRDAVEAVQDEQDVRAGRRVADGLSTRT